MRNIFLFLLALIIHGIGYSQTNITSTFSFGSFIDHTGNDLNVMKNGKLKRYTGININISHKFSFSDLQLDIGYFSSTAEKVSEIYALDQYGSYSLKKGADVKIKSFPIDLFVIVYKNDWFNCGIGPSSVVTNQQVELYYSDALHFRDKISSVGLGIAAFANLRKQIFADLDHFFFLIGLKARKIYSIYMITEGRKTGDYKINFSQYQIDLGFFWQL